MIIEIQEEVTSGLGGEGRSLQGGTRDAAALRKPDFLSRVKCASYSVFQV